MSLDLNNLLDDQPTIEIAGERLMPSWPLGGLCRYDSTMYREEYGTRDNVRIGLTWYRIVRKTPKGAWIDVWGQQKFVLDNARKRYAYPTEELARDSFIERKEWQIIHATRQRKHAELALAAMKEPK
jgi:hypothetical protein